MYPLYLSFVQLFATKSIFPEFYLVIQTFAVQLMQLSLRLNVQTGNFKPERAVGGCNEERNSIMSAVDVKTR